MKAATVKEIKDELTHRSYNELTELCLRLAKFKKENKELLTYLLFKASDEEDFIAGIIQEADAQFELINTKSYFYIKKSVRKILRGIKTNIRYSKKKETEIELLLYFCQKLSDFNPPVRNNKVLNNILIRETAAIRNKMKTLHEDLQNDYMVMLENL